MPNGWKMQDILITLICHIMRMKKKKLRKWKKMFMEKMKDLTILFRFDYSKTEPYITCK